MKTSGIPQNLFDQIKKECPDAKDETIHTWYISAQEFEQRLTLEEFKDWSRYDDQGLIKA